MERIGKEWNGTERTGEERIGMERIGKERIGKVYKDKLSGEHKKMKEYKVEISGTTPLLQNQPEEYGFDVQWIEKQASNVTVKSKTRFLNVCCSFLMNGLILYAIRTNILTSLFFTLSLEFNR